MDGQQPYQQPSAPTPVAQPPRESQPVHSTADYASFRPPKQHHVGRIIFIVVLILVVLAAGAGAYWFLTHKSKPNTPASSTNQSSTSTSSTAETTQTKNYTSQNFNLGFDYPTTWTVTDNGDGKLTAVSPNTQLKNASGQSVTGKITMTIQSKQTSLPAFKSGSAVAVLDSQKVAYTKPTSSQRAQTYLSFLTYAGSSAGIDGVYITGDNGYKTGQTIPQADVVQVDPLVTVSFTGSTGTALTLVTSTWNNNSFSAPITAMLKSLAFN